MRIVVYVIKIQYFLFFLRFFNLEKKYKCLYESCSGMIKQEVLGCMDVVNNEEIRLYIKLDNDNYQDL